LHFFKVEAKTKFGEMKSVHLWRNVCASLLYFVVRVGCRR